jgi:predicted secreted protein
MPACVIALDLSDAVVEFDLLDLDDALVEGQAADLLDRQGLGCGGAARTKLRARKAGTTRIEGTFSLDYRQMSVIHRVNAV